MKNYILLFFILFTGITIKAQVLPAPEGLICELLRNPADAVITNPSPGFGWIFPQSGIKQSAYQILVASSPYLLKEGNSDLWDSRKVSSSSSTNIFYNGKKLEKNSSYWWQVKVWSEKDLESGYSLPQQFNTGNFDRTGLAYPGESRWIELSSSNWVSEDKQCARFERFEPSNSFRSDSGSYFVEFEKSVIGILEFTATAKKDDTPISVYLGERRNDDNTVNKNPGRSNIGFQQIDMKLKKGTHFYIVKLAERAKSHYLHSQKLAPHYPDVIPFRYAEITGNKTQFSVSEFNQAALFYFNDEAASAFECSDENLKIVWDLCKYTQKSTPFLGVYADGNRERMPYEADAYIQQMSHFSVDREYSIARYTINFLLDHASWPTEWQMHMVLMAWEYYMQTGDDNLLRDRYEDIKRKSLIALTDDSGLISTRTGKRTEAFLKTLNYPGKVTKFRDIVDWPQGAPKGAKNAANQSPMEGGETDGYVYTDYNTVVNAFHYRTLVLMGKIAEVVGNNEDLQFFNKRSKEHKEVFLTTFFNTEKGVFKDGESTEHSSLHANMFPMAFGMVPEKDMKSVAEFIKSRGMACSVYGSQYLLEALYTAGEADHALKLMTSDSKRSWLNMIRVGSSMTTEAWDESFKPNLTWNHAWGSAPANITARKLMGIEPLEPEFSKFRISPQPGSLTEASIKVPCIKGIIESKLINDENEWQMEISVPGNTEAEVWIPADFDKVIINGREIDSGDKVKFVGGVRNVYSLKSGIFVISASNSSVFNSLSNKEKNEGWQLLFNGENFDGWRGINKKDFPEKGWEVRDNFILNTGEKGGSIVTEKKYENFELVWEWRLTALGANSGLKYFVAERQGDEGTYGYGIEFQLLDDEQHAWMKTGKMKPNDYHTLGAAYELYEPSPDKKPRKLGKWNKCRLVSNSGKIEHWLNGKKILEYDRFSDDFKEKVAASKFKDVENFGLHKSGHILLQDHSSKVYFRNLKIREL